MFVEVVHIVTLFHVEGLPTRSLETNHVLTLPKVYQIFQPIASRSLCIETYSFYHRENDDDEL